MNFPEAFSGRGGVAELARAMGVPFSTAYTWKQAGRVSHKHTRRLKRVLKEATVVEETKPEQDPAHEAKPEPAMTPGVGGMNVKLSDIAYMIARYLDQKGE